MNYIVPTERQVVRSLLNAIATHPYVKNAQVYYPLVVGETDTPQLIPLVSYRTFAGSEYVEDGLTLAVYPPSPDMGVGRALTYKDMSLGKSTSNDYFVEATLRLIVHLYYREPTFNAPALLYSDVANDINDITDKIPYGKILQYKEREVTDETLLEEQLPLDYFVKQQRLEVNILPGEEIIRDWMTILRAAIRDLTELKPFAIRNPTIKFVEYETPNWEAPTKNLVFHSAFMLVEYSLYEPSRGAEFKLPALIIGPEVPDDPPQPPKSDVVMPPGVEEESVKPSCPPPNHLLV